MKDYYKILGVSRQATDEEIRKAYKKLSMKFHPDRPTGNEEKFKEINQAYEVLNDPLKRLQFNQGQNPTGGNGDYEQPSDNTSNINRGQRFHFNTRGGEMPQGFNFGRFASTNNPFSRTFFGPGSTFENVFENDAEFNSPFNEHTKRYKSEEITEHILKLSLEEMFKGCETKISYPKSVIVDGEVITIPDTINLNIPAKCYVGKKLKVNIPDNINPQSIIIIIQPKKHPHYLLQKSVHNDQLIDLELPMSITLKDSLIGFRLRVMGIDGNEIVIEEGTVIDPRRPYIVKGKGFVDKQGNRGDLYVKFDIKYPKKLTQKQKNEIKKILG